MAERIDELQLLIGSDASSAIRQLGNLAGALDSAAASARKLSSATGFASHFVDSLNKLSHVNLDRTLSNLERLSRLDLSNLKDKTVTISLKVMGADETERAKYASQDAAKEIAKNSMQIAKALGQKYNVDVSGIKQLSEALKEMAQSFAVGGNGADAQSKMFGIISERGKESEAAIMGVEQRYKEFADYVNNMKFTATGITSASERENALSGGMLRNLKNDAAGIDQVWTELIGKFPDLFNTVEQAAANPSDQLDILTQKIQTVRALLEKHEIVDDNTFNNIGDSVLKTATESFDKFNQSKDKFMRESMDKIPIDLDIDQNRFETQIQQAITKATSKTYKTQPIKLELDNQKLRDSVESAFSLIDISKLPQFAQGFTQVSQAISTMNQVNFKDSGIDKFTASLRRLIGTDTSKFDVATFRGIADAIKDLASIGNVNKALNSFVSSIARLANAGEKTSKTADGMKKLVPELKNAVTAFGQLGAIDATITSFVASLAKLASAGDKADKTADGLGKLSQAVLQFIDALSKAPAINDNIAQTIQGLGNLAAAGTNAGRAMNSVLGGGGSGGISKGLASNAVSSAIRTLSNSFKTLLSAAVKLGGQGASALGNFLAKLRLIPSQATSIDRTAVTFGNLLRAVLPFYGLRGLFDWGKGAFEAGSAIVELENVIDTSFGSLKKGYEDISRYIYKWAQGTIDAFGVSQLAAERYAGRLMAMFNSSGFDVTEGMRDSAAKMTTELIERAGDVASFYDITVDEAMTKFQSGLAGMTRPLRSLGVNMSVANMQAYAMSQGITTAWKDMDQATQMALRYQYILNATQYAEGDFGRTSLSAANQVRILQLNLQQLSAVMGQGLISAIAPVISWLNLLIKRLIQAATAFRTFMWTLFGKPLQAARGTSDDMAGYLDDATGAASGLADGAGGAADNLGSAGKAAKNLKKQLQVLPFDELNQLAKDTDSAGSGGGGGGAVGGGAGGLGDLGGLLDGLDTNFDLSGSKTIDAINKWAEKIRAAFEAKDWKGLGKVIADGINEGFRKLNRLLDWGNWKPKVEGFIIPFQTTMNSMMANINWRLIGDTLGKGLNTITYTLYMWITGFEWRNYGGYLADGMNSMLSRIDAEAIGRTIASKFKAAWDFFGGWVRKFDFKLFGKKLKDGILGAIDEIDWGDIGDTLGELFNGINETIIEFLEDGQVANGIGEAFSTLVNNFISTFDESKAQRAMQTVKTQIGKALGKAIRDIDKQALAEDFKTLLGELPWDVISTAIGVSVGAKLAAGIFGTAFKAAALKAIMGVGSGATIGVGGTGAAGAAGTGAGAGAGIAGAAGGLAGAGGILAALTLAVKGIESVSELYKHSKGETSMGDIRRRNGNKPLLSNDYGADVLNNKPVTTSPSIAVGPNTANNNGANAAPQESIFTMILKGKKDPSFTNLEVAKASLIDVPIVKKIMDGMTTKNFNTGWKKFTDTGAYQAIKKFGASISDTFQTWWKRYTDTKAYKAVKSFGASVSDTLQTWYANYTNTKSYNVTKNFFGWVDDLFKTWWPRYTDTSTKSSTHKFFGKDGGNFVNLSNTWKGLGDKTIDLTVNLVKKVQDLGAWIGGKWQDLISFVWNAKGGLFTGPTGFQVFGEAGAEAAIPLERKSTMKRIANAIVDSGGMNGVGMNAGMAREIAQAVAPYIMGAVNDANSRPVQVNATLYTENDEVLARAVTRGQRSIDKRYNPVSQFSY